MASLSETRYMLIAVLVVHSSLSYTTSQGNVAPSLESKMFLYILPMAQFQIMCHCVM